LIIYQGSFGKLELSCQVFDGLNVGSDVEIERCQVDIDCIEFVICKLKLIKGSIQLASKLSDVKIRYAPSVICDLDSK